MPNLNLNLKPYHLRHSTLSNA
eukprot:SAG11_NODE_39297_length_235_cov_42.095588_1_plen_21_part_10